jgi:hypothetical protein
MWMRRAHSISLVLMLLALTNTYDIAQSGMDSHLADGIVVKSIRGDVSYLHNRPSVERLADHYSLLYSAKAGYGDPAGRMAAPHKRSILRLCTSCRKISRNS